MGELRIGPAGWNYRDWKGVFYPARSPRGFSELEYLAEYFDTAEINSSFYGPFSPGSAAKWSKEVNANGRFLFTAKLWQRFTHQTGANDADEKTVRQGFDVLQNAGQLGAVLLQFPFSFHNTKDNFEVLGKLFQRFKQYRLVLEVRHASWNQPELYSWLAERRIGFCNIDQPIIGNSLPPTEKVTSSVGYVRLHGQRRDAWFSDDRQAEPSARYDYRYTTEELRPWGERVKRMARESEVLFVITNNHPFAKSLEAGKAIYFIVTGKKPEMPATMLEKYPEMKEFATATSPKNPTLF
jgi:uncharacterized protein YecE (DUF72 family)